MKASPATGDLPGVGFLQREFSPKASLSEADDLIICADGGLGMPALGIKPHVVLGDFDSLTGTCAGAWKRRPGAGQCTSTLWKRTRRQ